MPGLYSLTKKPTKHPSPNFCLVGKVKVSTKMVKKETIHKESSRLQQKADNNNFVGRNYNLNIAMLWAIYPIASLFSALTQGSHLYLNFQHTFNNVNTALFLTILLAGLIELGKFLLGKAALEDIISGVFSEEIEHQIAFVLKAIGAVLFIGFSAYLSIKGAPAITEHYKNTSSPIELISLDSINMEFDAKLMAQDKVIATGKKMTWHGKVVSDGRSLINKAQDTKIKIEENRTIALNTATEENDRRRDKYGSEIKHSGFWFTNLTGIGEFICLICLFFWANYESGASNQFQAQSSPTPSTKEPKKNPNSELEELKHLIQDLKSNNPRRIQTDFSNRNPIGYRKGDPESKLNSPNENNYSIPESETPEPLETKDFQVETQFETELKIMPVSKLVTDCRNYYRRKTKAAQAKTREDNLNKYKAAKSQLEEYGYIVNEVSKTSLHIIPPSN